MTSPAEVGFVAVVADLSDYLSAEVTIEDIATRLGGWAGEDRPDDDSLVPAAVRADSPFVDQAGIACFPDSDLAYAVSVSPTADARPSIAALRPRFGEPKLIAAEPDRPLEVQFPSTSSGDGWSVVLVVRAQRRGPDLDDAVVTRILLRRDSRS